jgi:error-prone DNA polymerase
VRSASEGGRSKAALAPGSAVEPGARSAFSFLAGASAPEDLAARAAELGYEAMALSDLHGVYGAPRFFAAARKAGLRAIAGARLVLLGEGRRKR